MIGDDKRGSKTGQAGIQQQQQRRGRTEKEVGGGTDGARVPIGGSGSA